jgi:xanthine/uracil/vitamin C permease (AzgA family)
MPKIRFSWTTELVGGVAVFLAMSYVMLANPRILGAIPDREVNGVVYAGPDTGIVFASTCLLAGLLSIAIGARAWAPAAIACGMGLNSLMATFAGDALASTGTGCSSSIFCRRCRAGDVEQPEGRAIAA